MNPVMHSYKAFNWPQFKKVISDFVKTHKDVKLYQVKKMIVQEMNRSFIQITTSERPQVLRAKSSSDVPEGYEWIFQSKTTLQDFLKYKTIHQEIEGKTHALSIFDVWNTSGDRLEIEGYFNDCRYPYGYINPENNQINLFRSFPYTPRDYQEAFRDDRNRQALERIMDHLFEHLCNSNEEAFNYVLRYIAHALQIVSYGTQDAHASYQKLSTFLMFINKVQGVGKSIWWTHVGQLFGDSYKPINSLDYVTGRFNASMRNAILVVYDEADQLTPKQKHQVKYMVTSKDFMVEEKYGPTYTVHNLMHMVFLCNEDPFGRIKGEWNNRRMVKITPSSKIILKSVQEQQAYFSALESAFTDNHQGGLKAFAHILYTMELHAFGRGERKPTVCVDKTAIENNLDVVESWILERLRLGYFIEFPNLSDMTVDKSFFRYSDGRGENLLHIEQNYIEFVHRVKANVQTTHHDLQPMPWLREVRLSDLYDQFSMDRPNTSITLNELKNGLFTTLGIQDHTRKHKFTISGNRTTRTYITLQTYEECVAAYSAATGVDFWNFDSQYLQEKRVQAIKDMILDRTKQRRFQDIYLGRATKKRKLPSSYTKDSCDMAHPQDDVTLFDHFLNHVQDTPSPDGYVDDGQTDFLDGAQLFPSFGDDAHTLHAHPWRKRERTVQEIPSPGYTPHSDEADSVVGFQDWVDDADIF